MSLRCVEMSLFLSGKLSFFLLFSYTFRLRSSFINIFFSVLAPHATFPLRRDDGNSLAPDNLSCIFRVGLGIRPFLPATPWGCRAPHPSKASSKTRYVVNRILAEFPAGRKRFYNSRRLLPTRRKWAARLASDGDKSSRWQGTSDTSMVRPVLVKVPGAALFCGLPLTTHSFRRIITASKAHGRAAADRGFELKQWAFDWRTPSGD